MVKYKKIENTIRNTTYGIILHLINILGAFIVRTTIIYILGIKYVGLDGLFVSILSILNMAEMGFSSAVVYKLYKPIAEQNTQKVRALLKYYKGIYRKIGSIVGGLGIILIPFLPYFVNSDLPNDVNIYILYFIYLSNAVLSYWCFSYKTVLLNAQQRNDLISKISCITFIFKYLVQVTFLLITKNYYAFAILIPITTVLTNIGNAILVKKYYPQYAIEDGNINKEDKKEIKSKVISLIFIVFPDTDISASNFGVLSSIAN